MSVKVSQTVPTYDTPVKPDIHVHSHWNDRDLVVLEVDGQKYTVIAKDLRTAIENATNTGEV